MDIKNKKFCIIGKLYWVDSKKKLISIISKLGGIYISKIDKDTDYLVCNEQMNHIDYIREANKHQVPIITDQDILRNLNYNNLRTQLNCNTCDLCKNNFCKKHNHTVEKFKMCEDWIKNKITLNKFRINFIRK